MFFICLDGTNTEKLACLSQCTVAQEKMKSLEGHYEEEEESQIIHLKFNSDQSSNFYS